MKDKKSKIAIGTVQFGMDYGISNATGRTPKSEVSEILNLAHFNGIQTLDTAQEYGKSEVVMGEVGIHDFQVISKLSPAELKKETAETLTLRSLEATGLNKFYGMLFHNAESAMQNPSTIHDLQALKANNVISKWGYSLYTPQELEKLLDKYELPDLVQVPYNHLDNRFEPILKELHQKGVEVHTRSTFLQGLFFMNPIGLSEFFNPVKDYLTALQDNFDTLQSIAPALLNWVIDKSFIDKVVIGVNTKAQLESNIKGLETPSKCDLPEWISVPNEILMPNLWPKN